MYGTVGREPFVDDAPTKPVGVRGRHSSPTAARRNTKAYLIGVAVIALVGIGSIVAVLSFSGTIRASTAFGESFDPCANSVTALPELDLARVNFVPETGPDVQVCNYSETPTPGSTSTRSILFTAYSLKAADGGRPSGADTINQNRVAYQNSESAQSTPDISFRRSGDGLIFTLTSLFSSTSVVAVVCETSDAQWEIIFNDMNGADNFDNLEKIAKRMGCGEPEQE